MIVKGWKLYVHPLFHGQLIHLVEQVEALAKKNPAAYKEEAATRLLATINRPHPEDYSSRSKRPGVNSRWRRAWTRCS
jgi:hypothetical protein